MDHQRNIATPAARKFVLSRGLPKTGQITSYLGDDDGQHQAGWWVGRLNANNKTRYRLLTIAGDAVVLDRATGLMWAADGNDRGCLMGAPVPWEAAIVSAEMLTFADFTDWRLPNVKELISIAEYDAALYVGLLPVIQQPPFSNTARAYYWTSTTKVNDTLRALTVSFSHATMYNDLKTAMQYMRCVRAGS